MDNTLAAIRDLVATHDRFAVFSHARPDGDAYGTSLAFGYMLRAMGKQATVYNQDGLLKSYQHLPGAEDIVATPVLWPADSGVVIAVDTSTYERLGEGLVRAKVIPELNLDHHASNTLYGKINHVVGDSPASAQVLFEVAQALGWPLPAAAANCLYVGLMTDTGSFRYRGTTARTLAIASALVSAGADPSALADQCFRRNSLGRFFLMREVLNQTRFYAENRIAVYHVTPAMFASSGAAPEEGENFLDLLQTINTVEVAFMVQALDTGGTRVSLRSRARVDVSAIAAKFGGGGHKLAAGIRSSLAVEQLEAELLSEIETALSAGNV
jgi:bifunctional oligoribonuclease and PAP phosphatase NrnA